MEEDIKEALRSILQAHRDQRQEIDELASSLARLVRELEQNERDDERAERAHDREREKLTETLDEMKDAIESIGSSMRDLPEKLLNTIEKKMYELRTARYEALQAGVANEPAPLMPAPTYRDPTGRVPRLPPAALRDDDEDTDPRALTVRQQRAIRGWLATQWKRFVLVRLAVGGTALEGLHRAYDAIKHALGH